MTDTTLQTRADGEFVGLDLGDARRVRRLKRVAMQAAERPAGQNSAVFPNTADRQGVYGFLENPAISGQAIALASHRATALRCAKEPNDFVALDGSSLALTDVRSLTQFGPV